MSQITDNRHLLEKRTSHGRGRGWFAKVDIEPGTCVLVEKGVLDIPESESILRNFLQELRSFLADEQQREEFRQLHAFVTPWLKGQVRREFGVEWDNLDLEIRNDLARWSCNRFDEYGVGLQGSYFNHSCVPNTHAHTCFTAADYKTYHTLEGIRAGEELFISYNADYNFQSKTERRKDTLSGWGFTCHCTACHRTTAETQTDDDKRTELAELKTILDT